jgi:hypothetical protein
MTKIYLKEEKILFVELGYYHPSQANWSYHIWLVIDKTGARLYREHFGGDSRAIEKLEKMGLDVEKLSAGVGSNAKYRWKEVKRLHDIENYNGQNWGEGGLA